MVSVSMGFLFFLILGIDCVILLSHSLGLPYNYLTNEIVNFKQQALSCKENHCRYFVRCLYQTQSIFILKTKYATVESPPNVKPTDFVRFCRQNFQEPWLFLGEIKLLWCIMDKWSNLIYYAFTCYKNRQFSGGNGDYFLIFTQNIQKM